MSRKTHVRHEEVRESDNNRITDTFNSLTGGTFRFRARRRLDWASPKSKRYSFVVLISHSPNCGVEYQ